MEKYIKGKRPVLTAFIIYTTAVLYAISIVVLVALILIYVKRTEMPVYRKIIYFPIFMCVLAGRVVPV